MYLIPKVGLVMNCDFNPTNSYVDDFKDKQVCNKCGDIKAYHPINLCYNYEPKFNQVKKEITKPISWSNYFKSYFVEIEPEIEITYEPVYYEKCNLKPFDLGKADCGINGDYIGEISPNFPFIKTSNLNSSCCNTPPTPPTPPTVNWLYFKLEYIMNGMWIDISNYMTNYLLNSVYKKIVLFSTPIKYITENEVNIQMKNQIDEIKQMKNTIENMKTEMLSDLKNYDKDDIKDIKYKVYINEIHIEKLNNQITKLLMKDIKNFNIKNLKVQNTVDSDYEKIESNLS
jgi:hypothetical protein